MVAELSSQVTALPTPFAGRAIAPTLVQEYAGRYSLTPALQMTMAATDSGLLLLLDGRPPQRLYALDSRLFIRHGIRGFWVFERDSDGVVTEVVNWRDNNPVTWRRVR